MNRMGRGVLMAYVGIVVGRLVLSGGFGDFVQERMRGPLLLAAAFTLLLGLSDILRGFQTAREDRDRSVGPAVGWLLAAPLLVLVSVAPAALGAAAADRVDSFEPPPPDESDESPWVFPEEEPFELRMFEFVNAALWDDTGSLVGRQVILEGLVVNDPDVPDGFVLVRFMVSCCAADGLPLKVALRGSPQTFENDEWVRATVTLRPPPDGELDPDRIVEADIVTIVAIESPDSPYESPY